jgi:hypothetical protein
MKKIMIVLMMAALLVMTGCTVQMNEARDGQLVEKTYDYNDFTALDISSAFDVEVLEGDYRVVLEVDDRYLHDLKVKQRGGVLEIGLDGGFHFSLFDMGTKMKATITMPKLDALEATGATNVYIDSPMTFGDDVQITLTGASTLKGDIEAKKISFDLAGAATYDGHVETESLRAEIVGASNMNVSGSSKAASIDSVGASGFEGNDFTTGKLEAEASGASSIELEATEAVDLNASGASNITVHGTPRVVSQDSSGASSIDVRN